MKAEISLASLFIYNPNFGAKEGHEEEKIFYYYPPDDPLALKVRISGFCAGVVKFTETFQPNKPCESVHTDQKRFILNEVDKDFWMVLVLKQPCNEVNGVKEYNDDLISDGIYLCVLKRAYNMYKFFNGTLNSYLNEHGVDKLKSNLQSYFDKFIEKKMNIKNCDILNTFDTMQFMSLDRIMFLKMQSLLNKLEESLPIADKVVALYDEQVIWSGIEQLDISIIYNYLKEVAVSSISNDHLTITSPRFIKNKGMNKSTSKDLIDDFDKVYLGAPLEQYYLIPYIYYKLALFIFIKVDGNTDSSILKQIDQILIQDVLAFSNEIAEQNQKTISNNFNEKELRYIYFNKMNLAQKSTLNIASSVPKLILNFISDLANDIEKCHACSEIYVKYDKDYWIACKKSDSREIYVVVNQKNANIISIDEEIKQLCSSEFNNIFFME